MHDIAPNLSQITSAVSYRGAINWSGGAGRFAAASARDRWQQCRQLNTTAVRDDHRPTAAHNALDGTLGSAQ